MRDRKGPKTLHLLHEEKDQSGIGDKLVGTINVLVLHFGFLLVWYESVFQFCNKTDFAWVSMVVLRPKSKNLYLGKMDIISCMGGAWVARNRGFRSFRQNENRGKLVSLKNPLFGLSTGVELALGGFLYMGANSRKNYKKNTQKKPGGELICKIFGVNGLHSIPWPSNPCFLGKKARIPWNFRTFENLGKESKNAQKSKENRKAKTNEEKEKEQGLEGFCAFLRSFPRYSRVLQRGKSSLFPGDPRFFRECKDWRVRGIHSP